MRKKAFALWDCTEQKPPSFALSAGQLGYSCISEVRKDSQAALVACKQTPRTRPPSPGWTYYDSSGLASDETAKQNIIGHNYHVLYTIAQLLRTQLFTDIIISFNFKLDSLRKFFHFPDCKELNTNFRHKELSKEDTQ